MIMVPVNEIVMVMAEILAATATELSGLLAASSLVSLKLLGAPESPNVTNL